MQDEKILLELARLILPSGFIENFKIISITSNESDVEISLDEFDNLPEERQGHKIESNGFLYAVRVRDFPLRDKRVNFRVRRRKWYDHTTAEYFTNAYDTVCKGTRYSKEFAAFLKALPRDLYEQRRALHNYLQPRCAWSQGNPCSDYRSSKVR